MFKIEKNIPVIIPKYGVTGGSKYPLKDMVSGDSFAVPVDPDHYENWDKVHSRLCAACKAYCESMFQAKGYSGFFIIRKDRKNQSVRVWKV